MGFVFQNISQLAGFLIDGARNSQQGVSGALDTGKPDNVDFQAILESMTTPQTSLGQPDLEDPVNDLIFLNTILTSNFSNIAGVDTQLDQGVEVKERAGVNSDFLKVLLSNQKDSVTLNITGSAIAAINPQIGNMHAFAPTVLTGSESANSKSEPLISFANLTETSKYGLSFNFNDLIGRQLSADVSGRDTLVSLNYSQSKPENLIPIFINDNSGETQAATVKVTDLLNMLKEYPDAIDMEISELGDNIIALESKISPSFSKQPSSTFKFDLRDLLNAKEQTKVSGILTTSEKPVLAVMEATDSNQLKSIGSERINNIQVGLKSVTGIFDNQNNFKSIKAPVLFDPPQLKTAMPKIEINALNEPSKSVQTQSSLENVKSQPAPAKTAMPKIETNALNEPSKSAQTQSSLENVKSQPAPAKTAMPKIETNSLNELSKSVQTQSSLETVKSQPAPAKTAMPKIETNSLNEPSKSAQTQSSLETVKSQPAPELFTLNIPNMKGYKAASAKMESRSPIENSHGLSDDKQAQPTNISDTASNTIDLKVAEKSPAHSKSRNHADIKPNTDPVKSTEPIISGEPRIGDNSIQQKTTMPAPEDVALDHEQIATNVREMKSAILEAFGQRSGLVRIKLHPEHLGEISIRLIWKDDGLSVVLKAGNKESGKLLTASLADLKGSLEAANFRVNEINVSTQSNWDGKNLHTSSQDLSGDQRQSRQQKETSSNTMSKTSGHWGAEDAPRNGPSRQIANGWVDLTA